MKQTILTPDLQNLSDAIDGTNLFLTSLSLAPDPVFPTLKKEINVHTMFIYCKDKRIVLNFDIIFKNDNNDVMPISTNSIAGWEIQATDTSYVIDANRLPIMVDEQELDELGTVINTVSIPFEKNTFSYMTYLSKVDKFTLYDLIEMYVRQMDKEGKFNIKL